MEFEMFWKQTKAGQRGPGGNRRRGTRDGSSVREGGAGIGSLLGRHDVLEERVNQMEDQVCFFQNYLY